ncbi:MAG: alpha-glucosidase/alpha-galactosidase, partial [Lentisphaeria bacterium]|nr:alpha-glucosidase/alpha-galactosidase [Lentisphaeria bacterium]
MATKVTFIGAGSVGFTRGLVSDLMGVPEFRDTLEISLMDISEQNLDMVYQLVRRDMDSNGVKCKLTKTTNRASALKNAKYVISVFRVGGLEAFATDIEIPLKYGIDQCVGDTICSGGIMYGQRGIAAMMDLCQAIKKHARKDVLLLNYANPMAMLTWACNKYGGVDTVGLCHGVQGGHDQIAQVLGKEKKDVDIICSGINHQTWYTSVKVNGKEMTSKLHAAFL